MAKAKEYTIRFCLTKALFNPDPVPEIARILRVLADYHEAVGPEEFLRPGTGSLIGLNRGSGEWVGDTRWK